MNMRYYILFLRVLLPCLILVILSSCNDTYIPKPKSYPRVIFPEHKYQQFKSADCPFKFEYPTYSTIAQNTTFFNEKIDNPCWLNMDFRDFNCKLHLSYNAITKSDGLNKLIEDAYKMTNKHVVKAEYIEDQEVSTAKGIHGQLSNVGGNAASAIQFFLTDTTTNFIRGSLYFSNTPNADSLAPIIDFFRTDIMKIIETFEWTNHKTNVATK